MGSSGVQDLTTPSVAVGLVIGPNFGNVCKVACEALRERNCGNDALSQVVDGLDPVPGTPKAHAAGPVLVCLSDVLEQADELGANLKGSEGCLRGGLAFGKLPFGFSCQDVLNLVTAPVCLASLASLLQACDPATAAWFPGQSCEGVQVPSGTLLCYILPPKSNLRSMAGLWLSSELRARRK